MLLIIELKYENNKKILEKVIHKALGVEADLLGT